MESQRATHPGTTRNDTLPRVPFNGARPPMAISHSGELPSGKSGRHLIDAVWDIADTSNASYSCADVTFS